MLRNTHDGLITEPDCFCFLPVAHDWCLTSMFKGTEGLSVSVGTGTLPSLFLLKSHNERKQTFFSKLRHEWRGAVGAIVWLASSSCNEPKRVPIIPLAIKKEMEISSLASFPFLTLTFCTLKSFDRGWGRKRKENDC